MHVCIPYTVQKGQNLTHSQVLWLFKADPVPIFYKLWEYDHRVWENTGLTIWVEKAVMLLLAQEADSQEADLGY